MADALLSTPVALSAGVIAASLIVVAGAKLKKDKRENIVALMGVAGAFVFAAQMVNFAIPGTGSSGHIVGGVLLAALLGPWAAFITISSVLIIQCLVFADGGLMALGCNIINMGAMSTLVAYPLIFRPIAGNCKSAGRLVVASVAACIVGLEAGALLVVAETELSGITALPVSVFLPLMTGIHLAIGACEGLATAAILVYVMKSRPVLLYDKETSPSAKYMKPVVIMLAAGAVLAGCVLAFFASSSPDGLEWSIAGITGGTELPTSGALAAGAEKVQSATAIFPDYGNVLSGLIGSVMVLTLVWAVSSLLVRRRKVVH